MLVGGVAVTMRLSPWCEGLAQPPQRAAPRPLVASVVGCLGRDVHLCKGLWMSHASVL